MLTFAIVVSTLLVTLAIFQSLFGLTFASLLARAAKDDQTSQYTPYVSILMSLRGADSGLTDNIERLLSQDYPNYDLHVIVDNRQDPAWTVVSDTATRLQAKHLHLSVLRNRRTTCGFQNSSFAQAIANLPDACEVVVLVDGDLTVHPTAIRELVAPLREKEIGGSFGNRWFAPKDANWGSWVRYLWNVAAIVPMYLFGIPWGGCMAIRRDALDQSGLVKLWQTSMVHDAPTKAALSKSSLKLAFVPTLMMVIDEPCDLSFAHDFMKRQMMWTRLYHPNFVPVFLHAIATTFIMLAAIVLSFFAIQKNDITMFAWSAGGLMIYLATMLGLICAIDRAVRNVLTKRNVQQAKHPLLALLLLPITIVITQLVYICSIFLATFSNSVVWRGVTYRWRGPYDIAVVRNDTFMGENQTSELA